MGGEASAVTECNRSARRRGRSRFPRRLGVHGDRRASRQLLELRASAVRRATNAWLTGVRTACSVDLESRGDMDACGARGARPGHSTEVSEGRILVGENELTDFVRSLRAENCQKPMANHRIKRKISRYKLE